jgi:hypothetical protein
MQPMSSAKSGCAADSALSFSAGCGQTMPSMPRASRSGRLSVTRGAIGGGHYAHRLKNRMPLSQETVSLADQLSRRIGWTAGQRGERSHCPTVRHEVLCL